MSDRLGTGEKPRLLIIGSRGFVGSAVAQAATADFEVIEANRITNGHHGEVRIDVRDESSVRAAFDSAHPDAVMLLSAISDIDHCERFPDEARAVNLHGAEHVADACRRVNATLLFTSSGAVFDGKTHGYKEESPVSPISVYGETKALAELTVLALGGSAIVVRLALVLGFAAHSGTNALLNRLKKQLSAGQAIPLSVAEQRNPIDAVTASQFMLDLLKTQNARGIFHIGCEDPISRYELGFKLATRMGYPGRIMPEKEPPPGRAPRGANHYLLTDKLRATSTIYIPTCDQVIERCFDGLA